MSEKNNYPRILVISCNCFSTQKNNGKTLASYFSNYPSDRLAQLYIWSEYPDSTLCQNYYRITDMDMLKSWITKNSECGQKVNIREAQEDNNISSVYGKRYTHWHSMRVAREFIWLKGSWKTKKFTNWLENFSPDVILFSGIGNPSLFRIADFICKKYNIPIIVSIGDDYYLPHLSLSPFYHIRRVWLVYWMKKILHTNRSELLTINKYMRETYREFFNKDSSIMMNFVDTPEVCPKYSDSGSPLRIAYIGSLTHNRWKALEFLADVLSCSKYKDDYSIEVYVRDIPDNKVLKAISKPPYIRYCGSLDAQGVIKKQKEADILLLAESFDYICRKNTFLSLSTKITEYMAMGKPILAIGPPEIGSMRFLKDNSKAVCITKLDRKETINAFEILKDSTFRKKTGEYNWKSIYEIMTINNNSDIVIRLATKLFKEYFNDEI